MQVLIVDDHALFRAGIRLILERLGADGERVEVLEADSAEQGLAYRPRGATAVDLVLLDLNLQGQTGLDSLRTYRQSFPTSAVVILSGLESADAMREARAKGAQGYIVKSVTAEAMLAALRTVLDGGAYFPVIDLAAPDAARLTERQNEVLLMLCEGQSNKEIGRALGMSDHTVRTHLMKIFKVLGVHTRTEAARAARRLGLM